MIQSSLMVKILDDFWKNLFTWLTCWGRIYRISRRKTVWSPLFCKLWKSDYNLLADKIKDYLTRSFVSRLLLRFARPLFSPKLDWSTNWLLCVRELTIRYKFKWPLSFFFWGSWRVSKLEISIFRNGFILPLAFGWCVFVDFDHLKFGFTDRLTFCVQKRQFIRIYLKELSFIQVNYV